MSSSRSIADDVHRIEAFAQVTLYALLALALLWAGM
jgi:hypothetical protein